MQGEHPQQGFPIADDSAIGEARRHARHLAECLGLDPTLAGQVALVATELATNLLRHAGGGHLFIQPIATEAGFQIETLAVDRGPGMGDVEHCLQDGHSTAGSSGTGLGAVKRMSSIFDVHSVRGQGSAVVSRVGPGRSPAFGAVRTTLRGEFVCGDDWRLEMLDGEAAVLVIDGLGHGSGAAEAAAAGIEAFRAAPFEEPRDIIGGAHERMHGTRGAAGACARRRADGRISFAGIGNISGRSIGVGGTRGLLSHHGTLGMQIRRVQQFEYEDAGHALVVLHSDGLSGRWDLDAYVGLRHRHPALIAAVLHRDHSRERDDATIVVIGHD